MVLEVELRCLRWVPVPKRYQLSRMKPTEKVHDCSDEGQHVDYG